MGYSAGGDWMDTLGPTQVMGIKTCERCGWMFPEPLWNAPRVLEWCNDCQDILFDRGEGGMWKVRPEWRLFTFMGWKFEIRSHVSPVSGEIGIEGSFMLLWKKLINPETPQLIYSYRGIGSGHLAKERAAAWLIAHWWEHALDICPCQHGKRDDAAGSNFRYHVIESLLWYHERGLG